MSGLTVPAWSKELPPPTRIEIDRGEEVAVRFFHHDKVYTGFWSSYDEAPMEPRLVLALLDEIERLRGLVP